MVGLILAMKNYIPLRSITIDENMRRFLVAKSKSRKKKTVADAYKSAAENDMSLCNSVIKAHADFIAAIAAATEAGLRVDCGRDVGTPVTVYRPIKEDAYAKMRQAQ